jgi:hypothetical protein
LTPPARAGVAGRWLLEHTRTWGLGAWGPIGTALGEPPCPQAQVPKAPAKPLTRTSHQSPAAAADAPHPAMFSPLGVLDVPSSTPPRPSGRKPHWARHLGTLATNTGEKCGLARKYHRRSAAGIETIAELIPAARRLGRLPFRQPHRLRSVAGVSRRARTGSERRFPRDR